MTTYRQRLDAGVYKQGATTSTPVPLLTGEPTIAQVDELYACPDCDRTFDSEHGLKIHRTKTHGTHNGE